MVTYGKGWEKVDRHIACTGQSFTELIFFEGSLKKILNWLFTVGKELSAGVNNFLAEVLILGKSRKKRWKQSKKIFWVLKKYLTWHVDSQDPQRRVAVCVVRLPFRYIGKSAPLITIVPVTSTNVSVQF